MIDADLILRLVALGAATLTLMTALIVSAIRKDMIDGVLGFVAGLIIVGGFSVGAFGAAAVGNAIGLIIVFGLLLFWISA